MILQVGKQTPPKNPIWATWKAIGRPFGRGTARSLRDLRDLVTTVLYHLQVMVASLRSSFELKQQKTHRLPAASPSCT